MSVTIPANNPPPLDANLISGARILYLKGTAYVDLEDFSDYQPPSATGNKVDRTRVNSGSPFTESIAGLRDPAEIQITLMQGNAVKATHRDMENLANANPSPLLKWLFIDPDAQHTTRVAIGYVLSWEPQSGGGGDGRDVQITIALTGGYTIIDDTTVAADRTAALAPFPGMWDGTFA
jgi:hypothetical protein